MASWKRLIRLAESRLNGPTISETEFRQSLKALDDNDLYYARELALSHAQGYVKRLNARKEAKAKGR